MQSPDIAQNMFDRAISTIRDVGTFTVTDQHLALLRRSYVEWNGTCFGAPTIDPKRPYGGKNVPRAVADIVTPGWSDGMDEDEEEGYLEDRWDDLIRLHVETAVALQIALATGQFKVGRYILSERYNDVTWQPVDD